MISHEWHLFIARIWIIWAHLLCLFDYFEKFWLIYFEFSQILIILYTHLYLEKQCGEQFESQLLSSFCLNSLFLGVQKERTKP